MCAYGINVGAGGNALLGCGSVTVPSGSPFGSLDLAAGAPGGVRVAGWAIDPDTSGSAGVHVYVDGQLLPLVASGSRPDVGGAFPGYGDQHGYAGFVPAGPGLHLACAYGINVGVGGNSLLGCQVVSVPDTSPFGSLDLAAAVPGGVQVAGWAIDPDTPAPIAVHVYVDGAMAPVTASLPRPDVAAAYPGSAPERGYSLVVPAGPGTHTACAYGINVGAGGNSLLGCRVVTVR